MEYKHVKETHKRIVAAQTLLLDSTTSREKFEHIMTLLKGINPTLDGILERCEQELSTIRHIFGLEVVSLMAENLPETSDEHKRRKKAILFFVHTWKNLKSEVARVQAELSQNNQSQTQGQNVSKWRRIFSHAKGPLGIVTVVAVGLAALQTTAVNITIRNLGCDTMIPSTSMPVAIPGLSLPKDPIPSGGSAMATIPGLTFTIDGTQRGSLTAKAFTFTMGFELSGGLRDVKLDGASLLDKITVVKLSEKKEHELAFVCR